MPEKSTIMRSREKDLKIESLKMFATKTSKNNSLLVTQHELKENHL